METKHSPVPWEADDDFGNLKFSSKGGGFYLGEVYPGPRKPATAEGNAEFIVRAVNCHYELIEALEEAQSDCLSGEGVRSYESLLKRARGEA